MASTSWTLVRKKLLSPARGRWNRYRRRTESTGREAIIYIGTSNDLTFNSDAIDEPGICVKVAFDVPPRKVPPK